MKDFRKLLEDFYNDKSELGIFTTTNENGETVILEITPGFLKTSTYQNNDWIRINIYHKDRTVEETYEK